MLFNRIPIPRQYRTTLNFFDYPSFLVNSQPVWKLRNRIIMAVTRLERKGLRNKARAKARKQRIKELSKQPPIKNIDVEAIKEEFAKKSGKPVAKKESKKEEAPKAEGVKAEAAPTEEATSTTEAKVEEVEAEAASEESSEESKEVPSTDEPQAELREPAKAPREDAEAVEDKIEGEDAEEKA